MKKLLFLVCVSFLISACQSKVQTADISKINGYWEIKKVVFPDGNEKEYVANESYDFIEVKNNKGFRKKVMPQLDGTFLTNNLSETIAIKKENEAFVIHCNTPYAKWNEEILTLTDSVLVILNPSKKEYHYKKAAPINIISHGKKTQ